MRVPLSWLRDYVELPANPADLVERLALAGLESSGVQLFGVTAPAGLAVKPADAGLPWDADKIVLAKVLKIEKHPDADKLKLVTVNYGAAEPKTVVTGAPNIAPGQSGMKVVLGLKGSRYYYTDKDGNKAVFTLEPKALRGIMNDAMCMSNFELGIAEDHDGIIILDDADPAPGTPVRDFLGETVIEFDVLPNMARCLSLLGIAREVAALTGGKLHDFRSPASNSEARAGSTSKVTVSIADASLCPRYSATVLTNVKVGSSPRWMRSRLHYAGMRPINNVVDVTNYVMLEHGQPLHAFDYDILVKRANGQTPAITVRPAKPGEKIVTLDGQERTLGIENLVIADAVGPIALAGVMGGRDTEVTDATRTILLEAASFDAVSVRKTARQFNLFSESSTRYSKGVHPEVVPFAAKRAVQLFQEHAGAEVQGGTVESYPAPVKPQVIELNRNEIERVLGFAIPEAEVERVLLALQFQLEPTLWGWKVTTPPNRLDIQAGAADLIEELARVSGYDRLPERLLAMEMPVPKGNRVLEVEKRALESLANLGLNEVIQYALGSPENEAKLTPLSPGGRGVGGEGGYSKYVTLKNPISPERSVMRTTLLPGLLEVAARNLANNDSVSLFELGFVYLPNGNELPEEPRRLAVVMSGRRSTASWDDPQGVKLAAFDFFDLKGVLESFFAGLNLSAVAFAPVKTVSHLHPGKAAEVSLYGKAVGSFGELHPKVAKAFALPEKGMFVAELDAEAILAAVPEKYPYKPFNTLPAAKRDLAVIVAEELPAEKVLNEVRAAGGDLLTDATLFDVYRGESIPAGTKSLAFALTYQPKEKTLTDKELDKAHQKIEGRLKHVLKALIRGKDA
jgi:phenylalanyl-tRNA synthetase beta chain